MAATVSFALNHMTAPLKSHTALFDLAVALGIGSVEIRNDLEGRGVADGTSAATVRTDAEARGLAIMSINALQRFNDWTQARAEEAKGLAAYAAASGARGIVLVPVNEASWQHDGARRLAGLRYALEGLAPILMDAGIVGLVEPLGFAECSLRSKCEAIEAIDAIGQAERFFLVHDTFHHHVAGEPALFAARTALVHISGVADPTVATDRMRDSHRGLVGPGDRIGTIPQICALAQAGYRGPVSFEPFAAEVHSSRHIEALVRASMEFIEGELNAVAA